MFKVWVLFLLLSWSRSLRGDQDAYSVEVDGQGQDEGPVECDVIQVSCAALVRNATIRYPSYKDLKTPDLIKRLGYPVESHNITTEDGYILTLFRIPGSKLSPPKKNGGKIPVYLMHGILSSSVQWLWQPPNRALAFMLADAGFDVWIGNARGTSYSRGHVSLPSDSKTDLRYWDFSVQEMGNYDTPSAINYITNVTAQPSLYYIGHSLGTAQLFISGILHPDIIGPKIRTMFSMSTSGYIGRLTNPFFRVQSSIYASYINEQIINRAQGGIHTPESAFPLIGNPKDYCEYLAISCSICNTGFGLQFGINPCQTNFTQLPGFLAHLPDTTSVKTMSHISQGTMEGTFQQYDYGTENSRFYNGSAFPPRYDWSLYNIPTVIYYGENDNICVPKDVLRTRRALGNNVKAIKKIKDPMWTHMDNVIGKDADKYIYKDIINIMKMQKYG